jgi:hypothetical protein
MDKHDIYKNIPLHSDEKINETLQKWYASHKELVTLIEKPNVVFPKGYDHKEYNKVKDLLIILKDKSEKEINHYMNLDVTHLTQDQYYTTLSSIQKDYFYCLNNLTGAQANIAIRASIKEQQALFEALEKITNPPATIFDKIGKIRDKLFPSNVDESSKKNKMD